MGSRIARVIAARRVSLGAMLAGVLLAAGCVVQVGEPRTVSRSVELDKASAVEAEIVASSASIKLSGGGTDLMSADFRFNNDRLEPQVEYTESGDSGSLSVRQPSSGFVTLGSNLVNEWDIALGRDVPLDLAVDVSSGNVEADLRDIDLRSVDVRSSSGSLRASLDGDYAGLESVQADTSSGHTELDLTGSYEKLKEVRLEASSGNIECDLSGTWATDAEIDVHASSGQVRLTVPDDVNVRISADTSSGNVSADGFTLEGEDYVLKASADAPTLTIRVDVSSGNITLDIG